MRLPVLASVRHAYVLLWRHRALHAKAIWPPIVFLVAAEFLFHKVIGNADDVRETSDALERASYWSLAAIALLWLAGLKFLLSFSISWRRHILLGEKFDPFFFKEPFWKYLWRLILTYILIISTLVFSSIPALCVFRAWLMDCSDERVLSVPCIETDWTMVGVGTAILPTMALLIILRNMTGWIPYFTDIAIGKHDVSRERPCQLMQGNVSRYLAVWVLGMGPIFALAWLLTLINSLFDIDVSATPVALGESAFRQACLFIHFSLGASIGAITYQALVKDQGPETIR